MAECKKCKQRDGPADARLWEDDMWFVVAKGSPCCVCVCTVCTDPRPRAAAALPPVPGRLSADQFQRVRCSVGQLQLVAKRHFLGPADMTDEEAASVGTPHVTSCGPRC